MPAPVIDKRQLVEFFVRAAKPVAEWRIAAAHEKFAFRLSDLQPVGYDSGLRDWFAGMEDFGWVPVREKDSGIFGLRRGDASIAIGPGGQVGFHGAPLQTLHETSAEIDQHLVEACTIGDSLGIGFLGIGFQPTAPRGDAAIPDFLSRSCGASVTLHYADEVDMARKFRVALALQPIAVAIFASSPFTEGKPSGFLSVRAQAFTDDVSFVFGDGFGFERYADHMLEASPDAISAVRLREGIEIRGADSGSSDMLLALPSFWTGILYDSTACDDAWQLVKNWTMEERRQLWVTAPRLGFQAEIKGRKLADIAQEAVTLAQQGLRRRIYRLYDGADETRNLDILLSVIESAQSRADQLLMQFNHFPDFKIESIFETCRLIPPPDLREDENL